jgi:hypothetical protein
VFGSEVRGTEKFDGESLILWYMDVLLTTAVPTEVIWL